MTGIARAYPNGRNQESSSESIAAYEAISIYGEVMVSYTYERAWLTLLLASSHTESYCNRQIFLKEGIQILAVRQRLLFLVM